MNGSVYQGNDLEDEIADLERRLADAKLRLERYHTNNLITSHPTSAITSGGKAGNAQHYLLLLADSALPLGSFAFSSGLESYLAHTKPLSSFSDFLAASLPSYASTTLPYVLAAHKNPLDLVTLDDTFDATIMCTVGRRASIAQGRALLSIWDKSFSTSLPSDTSPEAIDMLRAYSATLRTSSTNTVDLPTASAHLGPLFGCIASILGLSLQQTAYVFMLSHVKALLSAAVRASMFGPYHAQKLLASHEVQDTIAKVVEKERHTRIEDAGQSVPVTDLWIGRHEILYSRIFNS